MPKKPRRPCRYPSCPDFAAEGEAYCPAHAKLMQQHYDRFARGYNGHKRYGRAWRKVRERYVKKHPLCEECLKHGRYDSADVVHYIIPVSEGGTNAESNLESLCTSCHERIHRQRGDR